MGEIGGVSCIYNQNYVSLLSVFGTGLPGLSLYYSIIWDLSVEMHASPISLSFM